MATSNKRKKAKTSFQTAPKNNNAYIIENARKLELYETLMYKDLLTLGMGYVIVSRKKKNGDIVAGYYLLDLQCLGVKDTFCAVMDEEQYEEHKTHLADDDGSYYIPQSPNFVFNLVYGAADYGEENGFKPEKGFAVSEYILDDVSTIEYEEIEFGRDGKPLYVQGPHDIPGPILATLNKNVGEGNYEYIIEAGFEDDEFEEE